MPASSDSRRWPLWLRIALWFLGGLLVMAGAAFLALAYSPRAQTRAVGWFLRYARHRTGFEGRVGYIWVDYEAQRATLRDLHVTDLQDCTMFDLPELHIAFRWDSLLGRNTSLDSVRITRGYVNIVTNEKRKATNITQFVDTIQAWVDGPPTHTAEDTIHKSQPPVFRIGHIGLAGMELIVSNESRDTIRNGIDYNHLHFQSLTGTIHRFRARADTLEFITCRLSTRDVRTGWPVHQIRTRFRVIRHTLRFDSLYLAAGQSRISNRITFLFEHPKDLSDFNNKVSVKAHLTHTHLDSRDLALFAPPLRRYRDTLHLTDLQVQGRLPDFTARHFDIRFGKASRVHGRAGIAGLPEAKPIRLDVRLTGSHIVPADVAQYLPDSASRMYVARMGVNEVNGSFRGTPKQFVVKADTRGDAGHVHVDIAMTVGPKESSTYKGRFEAKDFQLGHLAGTSVVGRFSGRGYVDGQGLVLTTARIRFKTRIDKLVVLQVPLCCLSLRGHLHRHKLLALITSLRAWKSGPFYRPGRMKPGQDFGLVWEKARA